MGNPERVEPTLWVCSSLYYYMLSTQDILLPPTGYKNNNFFLSICAQAPALAVEIDSLFKIAPRAPTLPETYEWESQGAEKFFENKIFETNLSYEANFF